MPVTNKQGTSLLEIVVALGIFMLFAVGIYSSIQYTFKTVYHSRLKILETAILNEQIEILRNMPFEDVGIVNGSPAGVLPRTTTTTRNNIDFIITRTIRNIDDPFDGTIELGTDLSPADYKFVNLEISCVACPQQKPIFLNTLIPPKYLEGNPNHGALLIEVLNANGQPVQGASVHISATNTDPIIDLTDTTNNNGKVTLVDLPPGQESYHITISKGGFNSDQTYTSSIDNPNPTQPPVSVIAQSLTQVTFTIDSHASIDLQTLNSLCEPIPQVDIRIFGAELIGTNPNVLRVDTTVTTNGAGAILLGEYKWDNYTFLAEGYDIIGAIPITPILLSPGIEQPMSLLLGPNTAHSLLVEVQDAINQQPVSQAQVEITAAASTESTITGVGHIQQTDWSLGGGQEQFVNENQYASDDGNIFTTNPIGQITLPSLNGVYTASGILESSTFDLGTEANLVNISWEPFAQAAETGEESVRFQIASSNSSTPASWEFFGPDGTEHTFYSTNAVAIHAVHNNKRFIRYKLFLSTEDPVVTPLISDIAISYTTSCTPPGQAYFGSLNPEAFSITVTAEGYEPFETAIEVSGDTSLVVPLIRTP